MYLGSLALPVQQLLHLDSLPSVIVKPAMALVVVASLTGLPSHHHETVRPSNVALVAETPVADSRRATLAISHQPSPQPIVPVRAATVDRLPAIAVPVYQETPSAKTEPPQLLARLQSRPPQNIFTSVTVNAPFSIGRLGQTVNSPLQRLPRSLSTPETQVAAIADAIPELDLDTAERPLSQSREPGGCITNR